MSKRGSRYKDIGHYRLELIKLARKIGKIPNLAEVSRHFEFSVTKAHQIVGNKSKLTAYLSKWIKISPSGTIGSLGKKGKGRDLDLPKKIVEENEILRTQNDDLRKKVDKIHKEKTFENMVLKRIEDGVRLMPVIRGRSPLIQKDTTEGEAVLLFSDPHFGEVVNKEEMCGINEYDMTVAAKRVQYMVDRTLQDLSRFDVRKLHVFLLGDFTSGNIHDELLKTNEPEIVDCMFLGANIVSQALNELSSKYELNVVGVPGNHGRLTKRKQFKQAYANWDYILYKTVEMQLQNNDRIKCSFNHSIFRIVDVCGQRFLLLHGDNIKSWMGVPWYGIDKTVKKLMEILQAQNKKQFDHLCLAHFHSGGVIDRSSGNIIINPSMIGGNEYSLGALFSVTDPKQLLFFVNKDTEKGIQYEMQINLKPADNIADKEFRFTV